MKAKKNGSKEAKKRSSGGTAPRGDRHAEGDPAGFSSDLKRPQKTPSEFVSPDFVHSLAVGHLPREGLSPQDQALFRAFQSNLLSLISHELRTPLMGVLNALGALEQEQSSEWLSMASRNALRLNHALKSLLDLAAMESGSLEARLREVELARIVRAGVAAWEKSLQGLRDGQEFRLVLEVLDAGSGVSAQPILGDAQKLARVCDLIFQVMSSRADSPQEIKLRISSARLSCEFKLPEGSAEWSEWDEAWSFSVAGALSGVDGGHASRLSVFAGTLQSEQQFLTRSREGLGAELLLVHEWMRLHHGKFSASRQGNQVCLTLEFPELASRDGVVAVLGSRTHLAYGQLEAVALVLAEVPGGCAAEEFRSQIKSVLFRSKDAVYSIPEKGQVALVLDDVRPEDVPGLVSRLEAALKRKFRFGIASCPEDGADPEELLRLAEARVSQPKN